MVTLDDFIHDLEELRSRHGGDTEVAMFEDTHFGYTEPEIRFSHGYKSLNTGYEYPNLIVVSSSNKILFSD